MSRISENIRKITKAWGGETTGSGITDALRDLYNSLPFSVKKPLDYKFMPEGYPKVEMKMVEIVPEQSVTEIDGEYFITSPFELEVGKTYKVVINDVLYEGEAVETLSWVSIQHELFAVHNVHDEETNTYGYCFFNDMTPVKTLAIYEEQEVVTPLDPKFVGASGGGATVLYTGESDNAIYHDKDLTVKVTREELVDIIKGVVLVQVIDSETEEYLIPYMYGFSPNREWASIYLTFFDSSNGTTYPGNRHTAEKSSGGVS